jgi:hypothetical protein
MSVAETTHSVLMEVSDDEAGVTTTVTGISLRGLDFVDLRHTSLPSVRLWPVHQTYCYNSSQCVR